jgi:methylmalonyl-CoA mutase N-terminal domain/subunit
VDPTVRISQLEKLRILKSERDDQKVKKGLAELKRTAEGSRNLMPPIFDAVKAYATLGEICDVMREVFGEYQQVTTVGK